MGDKTARQKRVQAFVTAMNAWEGDMVHVIIVISGGTKDDAARATEAAMAAAKEMVEEAAGNTQVQEIS